MSTRNTLLLALSALCLSGCITLRPRSARSSDSAFVIPSIPVRVWGDNTCGAGALSTILNHLGDAITEDELNASLRKARHGGVLTVDLVIEARRRGFEARLEKGDASRVRDAVLASHPPVLMLRILDAPGGGNDLFHYIVVDGIDEKKDLVRMQFGDGKVRWASLDTIEKAWSGGGRAMLLVEPSSELTLLTRGLALESEGKLEAAAAAYRIATEKFPRSSRAWTNLGNVALRRYDWTGAENAYRIAIEIDVLAQDALNNLAWVLLQQNKTEEAERFAIKAVALGGDRIHTYFATLGEVYAFKGDCSGAILAFRESLTRTPERDSSRSETMLNLGRAQKHCGDADAARETLESALDGADAAVSARIREELADLK